MALPCNSTNKRPIIWCIFYIPEISFTVHRLHSIWFRICYYKRPLVVNTKFMWITNRWCEINYRSIKVIWMYSCYWYRLQCFCTFCFTYCCRSTKKCLNSDDYKMCRRFCFGSQITQSICWFTPFSVALFMVRWLSSTHITYSSARITVSTRHLIRNKWQLLVFFFISVTLTTLLLFYGMAYIPLLYAFGQSFTSMSSLFSFLSYFFLIFSEWTNSKCFRTFVWINSFAGISSSFLSNSEENMIKYDSFIHLLLLFPDYTLRHAMNAMFIIYTKAQIAKQSSHFGKW